MKYGVGLHVELGFALKTYVLPEGSVVCKQKVLIKGPAGEE